MIELNWIAIILATLSTMVVGSIWYSPNVFGRRWQKLARIKGQGENVTPKEMALIYGGAFLGSLITVIILAIGAFIVADFTGWGFLEATLVAAVVGWLGFTIARINMHDSFEGRPKELTFMTGAFELVTILVVALIIGVWPA